jgi:hypothetical protein
MTPETEDESRDAGAPDDGILLQPSTSDADPMPPDEDDGPVEDDPIEEDQVEDERG